MHSRQPSDLPQDGSSPAPPSAIASVVEHSSDFIGIADLHGNVVHVNAAGRDLLTIGSIADARATQLFDYVIAADQDVLRREIMPALEREGRWLGDLRFRDFRTGAPVPVACNLFHLIDDAGQPSGIATISRDRRRRDRLEAGLRLLSRAGAATLTSLHLDAMVRDIAGVCADEFASYCIIDLYDEGRWRRTVVHRNPELASIIERVSEPSGDHPVARAARRGETTVSAVDAAWVERVSGSADRAAAIRELGVRSLITAPIVLPSGKPIGALTCVLDSTESRLDYRAEDAPFVEEVARRAGAAIANARSFERERRIAIELQAASLPATLPAVEALRLDAYYRPSSDEARIGGDWYDAVVLDDGRIAITVGDVLGHGLRSAVTMTKLRQAMQSAAMISPDPNVMLNVADKTLRMLDADGYATAIAAVFDPATHVLTFASAGHPGPVRRFADGRIEEFFARGSMLGLRSADERVTLEIAAPPGSSIVFYTDGLTEATRNMDEGRERLRAALARSDIIDAEFPAREVAAAVLGGSPALDDLAVLVARVVAPGRT